jgi:hypothetical protein
VNGPNATVAPPPVRDTRNLGWVGPTLVILLAVALMALAAYLVRAPTTVDHVTITNPVEQAVDVDVKAPGGPWLPVAVVDAKTGVTVDDVVDVGGTWIIRFRVAGEVLSEVRHSHDDLEQNHWQITVPTRAQ